MAAMLMALSLAVAWSQAQVTVWGGDHIEIEVTGNGARLEFDCAHGAMDEPVRVDATGAFLVKGTLTPERSGPSREDKPARGQKAIFTGTIVDDAMTLRIVVDGQDPQGTTYQLTRGHRGNVRKCRFPGVS